MPNHIIVIFDHSGSMSEGFSGKPSAGQRRWEYASHVTKIEEAKARLISWFTTSDYDRVTIVSFSSAADHPEVFLLPGDLPNIERFLHNIEAAGSTNLADALRIAISQGMDEPEEWYVRYLLVTDGLSDTPSDDLALVQRLPKHQGIDAIFIDPTPEGESHIRSLCIRGNFTRVYGAPQLSNALDERAAAYQRRTQLAEGFSALLNRADVLSKRIRALPAFHFEEGNSGIQMRREAEQLYTALVRVTESKGILREQIASADFPEARLQEELLALEYLCRTAEEFVTRQSRKRGRFSLSLAHPRRMSKGYSSFFLVQVFPLSDQPRARERISKLFPAEEVKETAAKSNVIGGRPIDVRLSSPEVEFSDAVRKVVEPDGVHVLFWGRPKDNCRPGEHPGLLTIKDADTGQEYDSMPFKVKIVDYAFDHMSRPLLGKIGSAVAGIGSVASFTLAFFGEIDKTFGLTSGTIGGLVAAILIGRVSYVYGNPTVATEQKP